MYRSSPFDVADFTLGRVERRPQTLACVLKVFGPLPLYYCFYISTCTLYGCSLFDVFFFSFRYIRANFHSPPILKTCLLLLRKRDGDSRIYWTIWPILCWMGPYFLQIWTKIPRFWVTHGIYRENFTEVLYCLYVAFITALNSLCNIIFMYILLCNGMYR